MKLFNYETNEGYYVIRAKEQPEDFWAFLKAHPEDAVTFTAGYTPAGISLGTFNNYTSCKKMNIELLLKETGVVFIGERV